MLMCMHRAAKHDVQKSAHAFSKTCPMSLWTCHAIFWMHPLSCKRLSSGTLCRVNHVVIQADACLLTFVLPGMGTPQVPSIAHAHHHMICTPLKWVPAVEHYVCCFGGLHDLCRHRFACIQTAARAAAVESDFTRGLYPNYLVGDSKIHNTIQGLHLSRLLPRTRELQACMQQAAGNIHSLAAMFHCFAGSNHLRHGIHPQNCTAPALALPSL